MAKTTIAPSISRDSYSEMRHLLSGEGELPATHEEWCAEIAAANAQRKSQGYLIVEVAVEPGGFARYCAGTRQKPSRMLLDAYAVSLAPR